MQLQSEIHESPLHEEGAGANQQLFWALDLSAACSRIRGQPLGELVDYLRTGIKHRQIRFFFNPREEVVGYVVWADVDQQNHERLLRGEVFRLHPSEWNEGPYRWLLQLVAPYGHTFRISRLLEREMRDRGEASNVFVGRHVRSHYVVRTYSAEG